MADKDLRFRLFGQDISASKVLKDVGDAAEQTARKVEASSRRESLARERAAAAGSRKNAIASERAYADQLKAVQAAQQAQAQRAAEGAAAIEQAQSRISAALTRTVQAAGLAAGAATYLGVTTAASMEQAQIGFTTLLGSAEKAGAYLDQLKAFAAATPFDFPGLVDASRQLIGVGVDASQVIPILTDMGDAAGALAIDQESFQRIMLATSQSIAAGTIKLGDMNQLMNNGLPVWKLMSEAMHKPVPALQEMISKGQLLSGDVLPKMFAQMHKDYGGAMAAQSKTLAGLWSTLKDTLAQGLADSIQPIMPLLKDGLAGAITTVGDATAGLSQTIAENMDTIKEWAGSAAAAAWWTARNAETIGEVVVAIGTAVAAYKTLIAIQVIADATNPFSATALALAALAGLFALAWQRSQAFREFTAGAFVAVSFGAQAMVHSVAIAIEGLLRAAAAVTGVFDKGVATSLSNAANRVAATARGIDSSIQAIRDKVVQISVVTSYTEVTGIANSKTATLKRSAGNANDREGRGASASDIAAVTKRAKTSTGSLTNISLPKISGAGGSGGGSGSSAASKKAQARKDVAEDLAALVGELKKGRAAAGKAFADLAKDVSATGSKAARRIVDSYAKVVLPVAQTYEKTLANLKAAQDKLKALRDDAAQYAKSVAASVVASSKIGDAESVGGLINNLRTSVAYAQQFSAALTKLKGLGADSTTIDQLIQAGPEQGTKLAEQIAATGKTGVAQIKTLQTQLATAGTQIGAKGADSLYTAGIKAADGLVAGLKAQEKALDAQMTRLGQKMAAAIKKSLKIKSPSRVFAEIGEYSGLGLVQGLRSQYGAVQDASAAMLGRVDAAATRTAGMTTASAVSQGATVIHIHRAVVGDEAHLARTVTAAMASVRGRGAA